MPLYSPYRQSLMSDCLNVSVWCSLNYVQSPPYTVNCLMVRTVHNHGVSPKAPHTPIFRQNRMTAINSIHCIVPRNILNQRSSKEDIDYLKPSADTQNRFFRLDEVTQQLQLCSIQRWIKVTRTAIIFSISPRFYITSTRQNQQIAILCASAKLQRPSRTFHHMSIVFIFAIIPKQVSPHLHSH